MGKRRARQRPPSEEIHPGALLIRGYLSREEQRALARRCVQIANAPAGAYTPVVRGGGKMRIEMVCLGLHWNAMTYGYEHLRSDYDGLPAPEIPEDWAALARGIAADVGMQIEPDVCILNHYGRSGKLGLHQDKDETPETLKAGIPIVSVSLGETARFLLGGTRRRKDPVTSILLESGDAFVMGGPSRMRYHGVSAIVAGTMPRELEGELSGRFNLTFRQSAVRQNAPAKGG